MDKINLSDFETTLLVRNLKIEDFNSLIKLQKKCFPKMRVWKREHIESQINTFPKGQIIIEYNGCIVASSSSLIIDFDEYEEGHTWNEVAGGGYIQNHTPDGDTLYGIEIMVDPEFRGMKLARRLYNARKQLCREKNLKRMVIGGRIPAYSKFKDKITAREYVDKVLDKTVFDPVLTTQLSNGFTLKRLIRSYLDGDTESDEWATLMEWVNLDYKPEHYKRPKIIKPVRICVVQYKMRKIKSFKEFAQQCEYFVDIASGYQSDFVLFPEIITTQLLSFLKPKRPALGMRKLSSFTEKYLKLFERLAIKYNVNVIAGSHFTIEDDHLFNIAYLFKRSGGINKQYKLHITPNEKFWWGVESGNNIKVFDTDCGKVAIQVCYDIEFPEVSRIAVDKGARIIFVPFCTNERQSYLRVRYCAQARCIENQIYVAIAGTVGNLPSVENMDIQYAQSGIYTPSDFHFSRDAIAAECMPNIETVVIHDVDMELLERNRKSGSVQNWNDRRRDIYDVIEHDRTK
jgi:predicted amidohydrolase/GNAT superfamily N-acetyltransferase